MNRTGYAISAYQAAQLTTPPLKMVVMLYDGILLRIARAGECIGREDYKAQMDNVMSAVRIIDGLNRYLDMEKGGQVAVRLRDTYESLGRTLFRSVGRDKETTLQVYERLTAAVRELRDAWAEIADGAAARPKDAAAAPVVGAA